MKTIKKPTFKWHKQINGISRTYLASDVSNLPYQTWARIPKKLGSLGSRSMMFIILICETTNLNCSIQIFEQIFTIVLFKYLNRFLLWFDSNI